MGLWEITANKISEIFGCRVTKKLKESYTPHSNRSKARPANVRPERIVVFW
jgi:hypothetical protein